MTLAHLLRHLIVHREREPVLLLLDDSGMAAPVPGLVEKLRSNRKTPAWLYWQSLEEMRKHGGNGVDGRSLILGACNLQMVFRLNDNESAQWMSDRIGTVDWTVRSISREGFLEPSRRSETLRTGRTERGRRGRSGRRLGVAAR